MTGDLTHAEIEELLGAYALNAVDPDEREVVARHLDECPRCRAEVADHRETAALLANSGEAAPEGLWGRIAEALEETPPPMRLSLPGAGSDAPAGPGPMPPGAAGSQGDPAGGRPSSLDDARRRRGSGGVGRRALALAAAAAVVVVALLGVQVVRQERLLDDMRATLSEDAMLRAANLALADPDATRARLESPDGEITATAVVMPNGNGYLLSHALPSLETDLTYQLWGVSGDEVISLGVLGAEPDEVVAFRASSPLQALAITEEVAPGVPVSSNPAVLVGETS